MSTAARRLASARYAAETACSAWIGHVNRRMFSSGDSNSGAEDDYFKVLQVHRTATTKEVQTAFRQAARTCHPDLHHADPTAEQRFRKCLLAYQVLSDPEARRCHELALDVNAAPGLRRAAAVMAFRSRAANSYDLSFWEALSPSHWRAIASAEATLVPPGGASVPAQVAANLSRELEASLHQVYFGPDISDVPAEHLPPAFEAEHRSHPLATDLLQLVSGQTLLGSVRCGQQPALPAARPPQSTAGVPDAAPEACGGMRQDNSQDGQNCKSSACTSPQDSGSNAEGTAEPQWRAWGLAHLRTLEGLWKHVTNDAAGPDPLPPEHPTSPRVRQLVFSVSGQDQVIGVIQGGDGVAGEWVEVQCAQSREAQAFVLGDMVADADGRHTHTIMAHATPGVLHTSIFSMAARKVIFKATRTWLPDPQYWFVPPRIEDYQTGGWYVEWAGHMQAGRPGWLHPGVACIILGMQALDVEHGQGPWWLQPRRHTQITAN